MAEPTPSTSPHAPRLNAYLNSLQPLHEDAANNAILDASQIAQRPAFQRLDREVQETRIERVLGQVPALRPLLGMKSQDMRSFVREDTDLSQFAPPGLGVRSPSFTKNDRQALLTSILGAQTFANTTGRSLYEAGRAGTYMAGATVGAFLPAPPLTAPAVGTLLDQVTEPALRALLTDLPPPTWGQKGVETALEYGMGVGGEALGMLGGAAARTMRGLPAAIDVGRAGTSFALTEPERRAIGVMERGNQLTGAAGRKQAMPLPSQVLMARTPEGGAPLLDLEQAFMNSYGGSFYKKQQQATMQKMSMAAGGELLNNLNAVEDSSSAARALASTIEGNRKLAHPMFKRIYDTASEIAGNPSGDTTAFNQWLSQADRRRDIASAVKYVEDRLPGEFEDLPSLLTTQRTGTLDTLPPAALTPGMPVMTQGNPGTYVGPGPQPGTVSLYVQGMPGNTPITLPANAVEANVQLPEATLGRLHQARSLFLKLARTAEDAARTGGGSEDLRAAGNSAHYAIAQIESIISQMPGLTPEGKAAFELANHMYADHMQTYFNKLIMPLTLGRNSIFTAQPDKFAAQLIKDDASDTIVALEKAFSSTPRMQAASITDPVARLAALSADNQIMSGSAYWKQRMMPQLQVGFLRKAIDESVPGATENLRALLESDLSQLNASEFFQAHLVPFSGTKLASVLNEMSSPLVMATFGSNAQLSKWMDLAKSLQLGDTVLGVSGTAASKIKQIAGLSVLMGGGGALIAGTGLALTGSPFHPVGAGSVAVGATLMLAPVLIARQLSDPAKNRQLLFAIANPATSQAQRTFSLLGTELRRMGTSALAQETSKAAQ